MANIKKGVWVLTAENPQKGIILANDILSEIADRKTILFLSGGSTPKPLYELLAKEEKLSVGAVGMADERFGDPNHKNSNEKMIEKTGLRPYLEKNKIPFYSILGLHPKGVASNLTRDYDRKVKYLLEHFSKSIGILGIGEDGHTASLAVGTQISNLSPRARLDSAKRGEAGKSQNYVTEVSDFPGEFKKRITLTFKALSKMDLLIILVFGQNKKKALKLMFEKGSIEEIPARFYTNPEVEHKTLLITDQKI